MKKRASAFLMSLVICVGLLACPALADADAPAETETPVETETPAETETPVETETPAETDAPAETETPTLQQRLDALPTAEEYSALSAEEQEAVLEEIDALLLEDCTGLDTTKLDALEAALSAAGEPETFTCSDVQVNPLYADVLTEDDIALPAASDGTVSAAADTYYTTVAEMGAYIREQMKARQTAFVIYYQTTDVTSDNIKAALSDAFDAAKQHTGTGTEGDYLAWQYGGYSTSISYAYSDGTYKVTYTVTVTYYTTAAQEAEMDAAVASLLAELSLDGKSDYQKVCAIYDWMCENITYDYTNLNDDDYTLKCTAYAALVNKTAVCQGYATLFYRLALACGIDARLIAGTGNGGGHAWNIVKLGGYYYNIDATWDAGRSTYSYFLCCNANFDDHTRDDEYDTDSFYAAYPMAAADYDLYGDADGSGAVNALDASLVLMDEAGLADVTDKTAADVNGDGAITSLDATLILLCAQGLIALPVS